MAKQYFTEYYGLKVVEKDGYQYVMEGEVIKAGGFPSVMIEVIQNNSGLSVGAYRPDTGETHILSEMTSPGHSRVSPK